MESMSIDKLSVGWFDLIVLAVMVVGGIRGRVRGMSEEFLPFLKWVAVVLAAGLLYKPLGQMIDRSAVFSLLFSYITAYLGLVLISLLAFAVLKQVIGGKPISGDKFGRGEYYLGPAAGAVRFLCVVVVCLSVLNARKFTQEETYQAFKFQKEVYGSDYFPTLENVQRFALQDSFCGSLLRNQLSFLVIEPTPLEKKQIRRKEYRTP